MRGCGIRPVELVGKRESGRESRCKGCAVSIDAVALRRSKKTTKVDGESVMTTTHHATVELSTKVTDTASKLRHTLAHELCHLAAWAIDGEMKPPHGAAFKRWCVRSGFLRRRLFEAPLICDTVAFLAGRNES